MASDDIWQAFLPKIRKTNHTSNLSQVSTTSSFTGGRLSLSCRKPTQTSPRIGQGTSKSAVSPPRTPTSKFSSRQTTPKSLRRITRTPKNKSPADGLSQKTIDSYFGNSFKKPETPKRINIAIIDLGSDSGEDENVSKTSYPERDKPSSHKQVKPNVSRVLFSSTSTLESCEKNGQEYINCEIEASIHDKENRNSSSLNTSKSTEETVNTSDMGVFKSPKAFKYKVASIANSSVTINISHPTKLGNSTQGAAIYKDEPVASTKNLTNGERVGESTLVTDAGCVPNSVGKTVQPSRLPECDKLGSNLDGNSESLALAVEKTQGKKKIRKETTDLPFTSKSLINNSESIANKHALSTSKENTSVCKQFINNSESHLDSTGMRNQVSKTAGKAMSVYDFSENFTGVTECVSVESSGEMWTPGQNSLSDISSSSEFDSDMPVRPKTRHFKKKRHQKIKNTQKKNIHRNNAKRDRSRSDSKPGKGNISASTKETLLTINCEENSKKTNVVTEKKDGKNRKRQTVDDDRDKSCSSNGQVECELDEDHGDSRNVEQEDFTLSGGFFPEEENKEKPPGQAFVIRTPSEEYLEGWGSLRDGSLAAVEEDNVGSGTEVSSLVADLAEIDNICNNSIAQHDVDVYSQTTYSGTTVLAPQRNSETLKYQDNLLGISLSASQWNKMPISPGAKGNGRTVRGYDPTQEHLTDSSCATFLKEYSQNSSKPARDADVNEALGTFMKLYSKRATSPYEGEEAPSDGDINVERSHKARQPETSPKMGVARMCNSFDGSSNSLEIANFSHELGVNNIHLSKEMTSSERVLQWVSQINRKESFDRNSPSGSAEASGESLDHQPRQTNKNRSQQITATKNCSIVNSQPLLDATGNWRKPCNVKCQVIVIIKSCSMNDTVIKNVNRIKCVESVCPTDKTFKFIKTAASLTVEVNEISDSSTCHEDLFLKGKQRNKSYGKSSMETGRHESQENLGCTDESIDSHKNSRRPVKVEVKFGKWGWEEFLIDCSQEESRNESNFRESTCRIGEDIPVVLCVQKVDIKICKCSKSMQIICILSKEKVVEAGNNFILRSRYHTSLKEYVSCWGFPENPLTLSMIAYSGINIPQVEISSSSLGPICEKEKLIIDPSQQDLGQLVIESLRSNNGSNLSSSNEKQPDSNHCQLKNLRKQIVRKAKWKICPKRQRNILHQLSCTEDTSGLTDDTPGLTDDFQEWMTPPHEPEVSTQDAASQWKDLMKRMQSGGNTLKTSLSIAGSSSSYSSVSSTTSCDARMGRNGWRSRGYNGEKNSTTCPFYKLIQGTKFAVDAFSYGTIPGVTHYFLSHFHYDHYMGLGKKFSHPIYCSSVTAQLVAMKIKIDPSLLNRLDPGHTVIIDNTKVTALDANHCPGSLMLLFELKDGRTHLHVGDFRAHPCMESYHAFWNVYIDQLYLDTTYCNPAYNFPSQQEVIGNVLSIVGEAVNNEPMTLIVCGTYTIGKERVFAAVAEKLKAKIWAPADKFKVLQCVKEGLEELSSSNTGEVEGGAGRELGLSQALGLLTKVKEDAQVHVLPMANLKRGYLEEHLYSIKGGKYTNVVAFHPTGWTHGRSKKGGSNLVCNSGVVKIYEVAYSEHSSFLELSRFVKFIQPKQVIKTVNVGNFHQREVMDKHINSWLAEVKSRTLIPNKYTDSPDTCQVTEKQKQLSIFQPKIGSKFFATRTNSHFPETSEAEHSENTQYSLGKTILSTQTLASDIEESRTDSRNLMPGATLKRTHAFNSGQYHKKRLS